MLHACADTNGFGKMPRLSRLYNVAIVNPALLGLAHTIVIAEFPECHRVCFAWLYERHCMHRLHV
jgi:hypothetical protein